MVKRPSRPMRRRRPARRGKRTVRRIPRAPLRRQEFATCKELYSIRGMNSNVPYSDLEQNLGFYKRATNIAQNYQFFRIKYVKYKFIARYNTYQATTTEATAFPIPLLYHRIDKNGSLPTNTSIGQLKAMGCKPIRFTKDIVVVWKPGVSIATQNADATAVIPTGCRISPWLMTNKAPDQALWAVNDTDHKGLYWYMETAALPADGTYEFDCEVEVMFEFKQPLGVIADADPTPAVKASTLKQTSYWKPSAGVA